MSTETRLKIALQKSGRLTDMSLKLLEKCGIALEKSKDQLLCRARNFPLDVLLVRDDDIPAFVANDVCQIGLVGQNVLLEKQASSQNGNFKAIEPVMEMGFGKCRLSLAVPHDFSYDGPASLEGKTIATSYKGLLNQYLQDQNISAAVVTMQGAVELAPRTQMADAICDLVSTGSTLASNGLKEVDVIMESQVVLVKNVATIEGPLLNLYERLLSRMRAVLRAENSRYIMLHSPVDALEKIKSVLPGSESPTILPLQGDDERVAVHAVCEEEIFWDTMEDLKTMGASSILVLPIEKMLD